MHYSLFVADDDEAFLRSLVRMLNEEGHDVSTATGHGETLEKLRKGQKFDAMMIDFWIDGQESTEILDLIAEFHKDTPVILITGGGGDLSIEMSHAIAELSGVVGFLQKPFRRAAMNDLLQSLLSSDSET